MSITSPFSGALVVAANGSVIQDTLDIQKALTVLSGTSSTLAFKGSVSFNQFLQPSGAISFQGVDSQAKLTSEVTSEGNHIEWNTTVTHNQIEAGTHGTVLTAGGAKGHDVISAVGHSWSKGQWVLIWSEDQIPESRGHTAFVAGVGDHPAEMHLISEVETDVLKIDGFLAHSYTANANAKVAVIPMVTGVKVDDLRFDFNLSAGTPDDFAGLLRFRGCEGFTVTESCRVLRNGPGAIWASLSSGKVLCDVEGSARDDDTYAYETDTVNGVLFKGFVRGTRHPHTTTSSKDVNQTWLVTVDFANDQLDVGSAHGLSNGEHVFLTGTTAPTGLSFNTHYWVVGATTNEIQVATTPGGTAVTFSDAGASVTLHRQGRWGTPRGVVCEIDHLNSSKGVPSAPSNRTGLDTHSHGFRVIYRHCSCEVNGEVQNFAFNARAPETIYQDCNFRSDAFGNVVSKIGRLAAPGCQVIGGICEGFWEGILIEKALTDQIVSFSGCGIHGVTFRDMRGTPIKVKWGSDHTFSGLNFFNSSQVGGSIPFSNKSLIAFETLEGGQRIINCGMAKDANDFSIDPGQLDETQIWISGCDLSGYGSGESGIGRINTVTNPGSDTFTSSGFHGYSVDQRCELATTNTLPSGFSTLTKYYVVDVPSTTTFKLSATQSGTPITAGDSGTGTHSVTSPYYREIRTKYHPMNTIDP